MNFKLLLSLLCLFTVFGQSQEISKKNEFRVNALRVVTDGNLEFTFERNLTPRMYAGVTSSFLINSSIKDDFNNIIDGKKHLTNLSITPYTRYSLVKNPKFFYYIEGFVSINKGEYKTLSEIKNQTITTYSSQIKSYFDFAPGIAFGEKINLKGGFTIDLNVGIGFNLINDNSPSNITRFGINLGYRF